MTLERIPRPFLLLAPLIALHAHAMGVAAPSSETEEAATRDEVAEVTLLAPDGTRARLPEAEEGEVLVVTYTGVGCPIAMKYAPRLSRLHADYGGKGVRFVAVNANPQDSLEEIAKEARELEFAYPIYKDFRHELTEALDARLCTEVFVFDADGALRYRGAVDDQYSVGASLPAPRHTFLIDALDAVLSGGVVEKPESRAAGCLITRASGAEVPEAVTWNEHIEPIVRANCQVCHRPGQVGPFSLTTYEDASGWANMIRRVVNDGRMPPWNADPHFGGMFLNERSLTDREKLLINRWVKAGAPRGEGDAPGPKAWAEGWRIGTPDAVFTMSEELAFVDGGLGWRPIADEGFEVPREGVVDYKYFQAKTDFAEDKWVVGMEARPGAADVVHHVLVYIADENPRRLGPPGGGVESYFCVAVPGDTPAVYPAGHAKRLPAGATLRFQVHYTPNGKQRFDKSSIGLVFADGPVEHEVLTSSVHEERFRIPPEEPYHEVEARKRINEDIRLLAFFPHMHTRGKDFEYFASFPDGRDEPLLYSHFDFNWQESYVLREPIRLPRGTVLTCVGHFDNSADNPNNPDPSKAVTWGEQTFDEMFIGYYDYVVDKR